MCVCLLCSENQNFHWESRFSSALELFGIAGTWDQIRGHKHYRYSFASTSNKQVLFNSKYLIRRQHFTTQCMSVNTVCHSFVKSRCNQSFFFARFRMQIESQVVLLFFLNSESHCVAVATKPINRCCIKCPVCFFLCFDVSHHTIICSPFHFLHESNRILTFNWCETECERHVFGFTVENPNNRHTQSLKQYRSRETL